MYLIELHYHKGEMQIHPTKFERRIQAEEYVKILTASKRFDHLKVIMDTESNTQLNTQKQKQK